MIVKSQPNGIELVTRPGHHQVKRKFSLSEEEEEEEEFIDEEVLDEDEDLAGMITDAPSI